MQKLAINSISNFASCATVFVVIAPEVVHSDTGRVCNYATYQRRMWCKAEQLCHWLHNGQSRMWVATTMDDCNELSKFGAQLLEKSAQPKGLVVRTDGKGRSRRKRWRFSARRSSTSLVEAVHELSFERKQRAMFERFERGMARSRKATVKSGGGEAERVAVVGKHLQAAARPSPATAENPPATAGNPPATAGNAPAAAGNAPAAAHQPPNTNLVVCERPKVMIREPTQPSERWSRVVTPGSSPSVSAPRFEGLKSLSRRATMRRNATLNFVDDDWLR